MRGPGDGGESEPAAATPPAAGTADHQDAAERLLETIAAACDPTTDFIEQLRSTLTAALTLLAAESDLARLLFVEPSSGGDLAAAAQWRWRGRCAGLLRRAARSRTGAGASPLFLEPLLIDGACWRISGCLRSEGAERLVDLLPDLLECVLAYYFEPAELGPILATARASG